MHTVHMFVGTLAILLGTLYQICCSTFYLDCFSFHDSTLQYSIATNFCIRNRSASLRMLLASATV